MLAEVIHSVADFANQVLNFVSWCSLFLGVLCSVVVIFAHLLLNPVAVKLINSVLVHASQALLAYGLSSSRRAPDALHP